MTKLSRRWTAHPTTRRGRTPVLEQLEERTLLSDGMAPHVFARFDGVLPRATDTQEIEIALTPRDFTLERGRPVLLGFQLRADTGSSLDPAAVQVREAHGRLINPTWVNADLAGRTQSLTLAELQYGNYRLLVRGERGTTGTFQLDVFLAGDANGDRKVDAADRDILNSLLNTQAGDGRYRVAADADLDGRITAQDLALGLRNLNEQTRLQPLTVAIGLSPDAVRLADGGLLTGVRQSRVVGVTSPNADVSLDTNGDGRFREGSTHAQAAGTYTLPAVLREERHTVTVRATDGFGQQRTAAVPVTLDTHDPTVTLTSPAPGLQTHRNVTVMGRVMDTGSGVAAVQAQIDHGSLFPVAFDAAGNVRFDTTLPLNGTADGRHTVRVRATDRAGNVSRFFETHFTLDTQAPTARLAPPASFSTLASFFDVFFSQPMAPGAFVAANYSLAVEGGPEHGQAVRITSVSQRNAKTARIQLAEPLAEQSFRLTPSPAVTDLAGNSLAEPRALLFAVSRPIHVFARFEGVLAAADTRVIPITLAAQDFTLRGGRVVLGFQLRAADGSSLDPAAVQIQTANGTPVQPEFVNADLAGNRQSLVLAELGLGSYRLTAGGERGTGGAFVLDVFLAGDVDGNRQVDHRDRELIENGEGHGVGERQYRVAADANLDGRINGADVSYWARNQGDATRINPLDVTLQLTPEPTELPDNTLVTTVRTNRVAGTTTPFALVTLLRDGLAQGSLTATAAGTYSFSLDLAEGRNTLEVRASDTFGQQRSNMLQVSLDTQAPQVTITNPASGLLTNRNVSVTGRVTDAVSGVASLQARLDGSAFGPVVFDAAGNFSFDTSLVMDGSADGVHTVRLQATDRAGNVSSFFEVTFTLDTQTPTVTIQSPGPGSTTTQNLTILGRVADALTGVASLQVQVDAGQLLPLAFNATGDFAFATTFPLDGLADGTHLVSFQAADRAGNVSRFFDVFFTLDSQAPTVTLTSPVPGLTTSRNVTVAGRATDATSGVASLQACVDSGAFGPVAFDDTGNFSFDTSLLVDGSADGVHTVRLQATDRAGNVSSFFDVAFTLDTQAPTVAIQSPSPGLTTRQNVTLVGRVADALAGVAELQLKVDGGPLSPVSFNAATGDFSFATTFPLNGTADGPHTVSFQAADRVGNVSRFFDVSFTLDSQAPTVTLTSPTAGQTTNRNVTVAGRVTDAVAGVASLQAQIDSGSFFTIRFDGAGNFSFDTTLPLNGTADGSHAVHLQATDRAGNVSSFFDVSFTLDTQAPTITLQSPLSGLTTKQNVTIVGRVTDTLSGVNELQVQVDAGQLMPITFNPATGDFAFATTFPLNGTADGSHRVSFQASDRIGNLSGLVDFTFTLDSQAPTVTLTSPTPGQTTDRNVNVLGRVTDAHSGVASLQAQVDAGSFFAVTFDGTGNFSFATTLLVNGSADGLHTVRLVATDVAGNLSTPVQVTFRLDTVPLEAPTFELDAGSDFPPIGDLRTTFATVTLVGQTLPGSAVALQPTGAATTADATGRFTFLGVPLALGANAFTVRVTDAAGRTAATQRTITRIDAPPGTIELAETNNFLTQVSVPVSLGEPGGTRSLRVSFAAQFDTSDPTAASEDVFLVYLMSPVNPNQTLLDRGEPGTALFSLAGKKAEYTPGRVHYDGANLEIDVTGVGGLMSGVLVFQLINSDGDNGTRVQIGPVANTVDPEGVISPTFPYQARRATAGPALNLASLTASTSLQLQVSNVRFDAAARQYLADVQVRNNGPAVGRKLAVVFSGLPADVRLLSPSGTDATGAPYLNFENAIPAGGLATGRLSDPVPIAFSNLNLLRFGLRPTVLVGLANRAPVFNPVGPLSVLPGHTLSVSLSASDPDGDRVTFALRPNGPLPTSKLQADGTLVLMPTPAQLGSYTFTLIASDGALETSQSVTLTVTADPVTTTRLSGRVLATTGAPLANVPIEVGRFRTETGPDGSFTLALPTLKVPTEDFAIPIPPCDPHFDPPLGQPPQCSGTQTIPFRRAIFDTTTGTSTANPRRNPSQVTHFIDASMVYGSDPARALALRANDGTGRLKTSPGNLPPLNNATYFPGGPLPNDNEGLTDPNTLYATGDVRANENVALNTLHILLLREHNRLADEVRAAQPGLSDEQIYQKARHTVSALVQHITYNEFLPALLGAGALRPYTGYNPNVDPSLSAMFSVAAFRVGHTLLSPDFPRLDAAGASLPGGPLSMRDAFFTTTPIANDGIDPYLRGLVAQRAQHIDAKVIDAVRNFLFGPPGVGGMDLPAMNIQRGRDMGLPGYNQARADFGLLRVTSFAQITSDPAVQAALQTTYGTVDKIDAWVGGVCEDHAPGSAVGPFFRAVLKDQFERARDGDRFWYENGQFTTAELATIRGTTLAALIQRNTGITGLPANVFTQLAAPAGPAPAGSAAATPPGEFRSIDGRGNNLAQPALGSAGTNLLTNFTLSYGDGISSPTGADRPNPRAISNAVNAQGALVPNAEGLTSILTIWGQILDHDLGLTPGGISDTMKIHGQQFVGARSYPFVAEKLPLMLERAVFPGVNNVIARPIYLPAIDTANAVTINPNVTTTVTTAAIPGAALTVTAGNLKTRNGPPFTGQLSITEVPVNLTPAALPANLFPDLVVTIQPADMSFTTPAPLSLPNRSGWEPGRMMDLWSINPITGFFDKVGTAQVSADGSVINTVTGGIRTSSWHFIASQLKNTKKNKRNQDKDHKECPPCPCECSAPASSDVRLHSGTLVETHDLAPYQSLGVSRGLRLTYDSERADPRPIIHFGYDNVTITGGNLIIRVIAQLTVSRGQLQYQVPGFAGGQYGLVGGEHFWTIPGNGPVDAALQVDLRSQPSGQYDYALNSGVRQYNGLIFAGSATTTTGKITHVNLINSPFGSGWGLAGLQELVVNPDDSVLLIDGGGTQQLFQAPTTAGGPYVSPSGDFSTLRRRTDGTFTRTMKDRTVYSFNAQNKLELVQDRNGNLTRHVYDPVSGLLAKIIDAVGLETVFTYTGTKVSTITDPAGRATQLQYDAAGNLVRVIDPDGSQRTWEYDADHHQTAQIDKRGTRSEDSYDFAGRATQALRKDGSVIRIDPVQTQGLYRPTATIDPCVTGSCSLPPPTFNLGDPLATYADGNGNVKRTLLDQAGQTVSATDGGGVLPSFQRNAQNLVTQATDSRGTATNFVYDAAGNVVRASDPLAIGGGGSSVYLFPGAVFQAPVPGAGTGTHPVSVALGDVNGDGLLDVVTANYTGDSVSVLLGDGAGRFGTRTDFAAGSRPVVVVLGDVNRDGKLDVVTANYAGGNVSVLLGDGTGSFGAPRNFPIGNRPHGLAIGDANKDGKLDLVAANARDNQVSVVLGDGLGNFGAPTSFAVGSAPQAVALGDLNRDGNLDLVTANFSSNNVTILRGDGLGGFGNRIDRAVGSGPQAVAVGDVNGDGALDILTANYSANNVSVLLGDGTGNFGPLTNFATGLRPQSIALGDLNRDGKLDVVTASFFSNNRSAGRTVSVLLGSGTGSFGAPNDFLVDQSPASVAVGDVDLDGNLDIVTANYWGSSSFASGVSVLIGDGTGRFNARSDVAIGSNLRAVALGDVNRDGNLDLVTANDTSNSVSVALGLGAGRFGPLATFPAGVRPFAVALGDMNGDGNLDIVTANQTGNTVSVLLGNGAGGFGAATSADVGRGPQSLALGDVNKDGKLDVATANNTDNTVTVLLGNGNGGFEPSGGVPARTDYAVGALPVTVLLGDLDNDGDLDLVAGNRGNNNVSVLLGDGTGRFGLRTNFPGAAGLDTAAMADLNGDGNLDLAMTAQSGVVTVLLGDGTGRFGAPINSSAGPDHFALTLGDVNRDGRLDVVTADRNHNSMSVLLGDGTGRFGTATSFTVGASPVAVALGDLDGDGDLDVVTGNLTDRNVSVLLGTTVSPGAIPLGTGARIFTYDATFNQRTSMTDELGRRTLYDIDPANGNVRSVTRVVGALGGADDVVMRFTYTAQGQVDLMTDPLGRVTDYDYDDQGRLVQITIAKNTPDQGVRRFEYDMTTVAGRAGNVTASVDENGNRTRYEYDAMNRLVRLIEADPDGAGPLTSPTSVSTYDPAGNRLTVLDARRNLTRYEYDVLNRLTKTTDANGGETRLAYDPAGNVVLIVDPLGHATQKRYDARNRLVTSIDPDGGRTQLRYDVDDNLTLITDPVGNRTLRVYDSRNRMIREVDPLNHPTVYVYDPVNNLSAMTDRNIRKARFQYDELDRRTSETWLGTSQVVRSTYDLASNLSSLTDNFSSLTYTYDNRDRVKTVDNTGTPGAPRVVLTYSYDAVGNVLSVADSINGQAAGINASAYDALNRMTRITQSGTSVQEKRVDLAYNDLGQFASINRYANLSGTQLVVGSGYTYDNLNRLTALTHTNAAATVVAFENLTYDSASRITRIVDTDGTSDYTYDDRDQLRAANHTAPGNPNESYTYDANGNRVSSSLHGNGYVTGPDNRLLSDGTFNYAYDNEGNLTRRTEIATGKVREFQWDHRNRLVSITDKNAAGSVTQRLEFTYDALDRRIAKEVFQGASATLTHFVYSGSNVLLDFVDDDGRAGPRPAVLSERYLHGRAVDQVFAQEDGSGNVLWHLTDHLGTVRDLVSNSGAVVNHIIYDSFGNVISQSNLADASRYMYTGREFDMESGLDYYRARYYDSQTGRFVSGDPIGQAGGMNLYTYVSDDPVNALDPFGLVITRTETDVPGAASYLTTDKWYQTPIVAAVNTLSILNNGLSILKNGLSDVYNYVDDKGHELLGVDWEAAKTYLVMCPIGALGAEGAAGAKAGLVDPRKLFLPPSRIEGADRFKLADQLYKYGSSLEGMPAVQAVQGANGELIIYDGVTRATRAAMTNPGAKIPVTVTETVPGLNTSRLPTVGDIVK